MVGSIHTPSWLKFFKLKFDFFALLHEQAEVTHRAMSGLQSWLENGARTKCAEVHNLEHKADDLKRRIETSLSDTFVTPFDREEIYDLSECMDLILSGAKLLVKDMEFFEQDEVNEHMVEISKILADGTKSIVETIKGLENNVQKAQSTANKVRKTLVHAAGIYRQAMKEAYEAKSAKDLIRKKQIYDYLISIAERVETVGERLFHLSIKNG